MKKTVLVIDEEKDLSPLYQDNVEEEGYRVLATGDIEKALFMAKTLSPNLVLMDTDNPQTKGVEFLRDLRKGNKEVPVVMVTGCGTLEDAREAMELGAYDYITKPFDVTFLKSIIKEALEVDDEKGAEDV